MERIFIGLIAIAMAIVAAGLMAGGIVLINAGGSPYYLVAGIAVFVSAFAVVARRPFAIPVFGVLLAATLLWSLWEVQLDGWALVPRLAAPCVLGLILLASPFRRRTGAASAWWIAAPILASVLAIGLGWAQLGVTGGGQAATVTPAQENVDGDWRYFGRTVDGQRYSPLSKINTGNVKSLQLAWDFTSDVAPYGYHSFEATPLAVNGLLYVCLDRNVIVALDQETGKQVWRFDPHPNLEGVFAATCRGVAYYEAPQQTAECPKRIIFGVQDERLMAVDADTGQLCQSFGKAGAVDLKEGLGQFTTGIAFPTGTPTIVGGAAIISGWVNDGDTVGEPSGVIRAFDAVTGAIRWAWDSGRAEPAQPLAPGETYTRGAPNAWGVFSGDEQLGLVYFGTGVSTPDYFGAHRTPEAEKYDNSIVALDVVTGKPRWSFQVVHHDIWDYDIASQPVLVDLPIDGARVPALIGPTKRGQFFVLDRRDGHPLYPVEEKPAPQGAAEGDWAAKTQPYSAFENVAGPPLTEAKMWGVTPLDQLWCRIQFKQARYDGDFTPPGVRTAIFYPGSAGGVNWGSVTIDPVRDIMVSNSLYMPDIGRLIPRAEADKMAEEAKTRAHADAFAFPQLGTPYAMQRTVFLNPLGVPCPQPPYGRLNTFDLKTGKLIWTQALGTAYRAGPFGLESHIPARMGVPDMSGTMATAGGLIFFGGSQDRIFRGFDIGNGKELWHYDLPSIGAAVPMTYISKSGRQFVVISAGGHPGLPGPIGSHVLAFVLPAQP